MKVTFSCLSSWIILVTFSLCKVSPLLPFFELISFLRPVCARPSNPSFPRDSFQFTPVHDFSYSCAEVSSIPSMVSLAGKCLFLSLGTVIVLRGKQIFCQLFFLRESFCAMRSSCVFLSPPGARRFFDLTRSQAGYMFSPLALSGSEILFEDLAAGFVVSSFPLLSPVASLSPDLSRLSSRLKIFRRGSGPLTSSLENHALRTAALAFFFFNCELALWARGSGLLVLDAG